MRYGLAVALLGIIAWCARAQPNVILIMTDDQGYGDMSCHGNPILKTPNIDRLWAEAVRLTDYHVSPTCAPTRGALLTGRYSNRVGTWHVLLNERRAPAVRIRRSPKKWGCGVSDRMCDACAMAVSCGALSIHLMRDAHTHGSPIFSKRNTFSPLARPRESVHIKTSERCRRRHPKFSQE